MFGSVARDKAGPDSDINLLVDLIQGRNLRPEFQPQVETQAIAL